MSLYEMTVKDAHGQDVSLNDYRGKVLLIVNTATHCGFTPQYEGLQKLYETYHDQGFEILDFPCNQFADQAPEPIEEILDFCQGRFGVTFKQFAKIDVNGENESPLFTWLKSQKRGFVGESIKWNFTKFLVDAKGNVVKRFAPTTKPSEIEEDIKRIL